ncbi:sensor domain-containing phosphodiesterase [Nitrincola alkalisediminis]|uniref:sensor domain-containing phosphodiesterase n=1 Tax=Nitrincola alkalisediminis TaxID=1366656 RepID=UPI001875AFCF|nr:EAL domain-containing protein [Nitrincola alkalisediminis]
MSILSIKRQLKFQKIATRTAAALSIAKEKGEFDAAINACLKDVAALFKVDRAYMFEFSQDLTQIENTHNWITEGLSLPSNELRFFYVQDVPWWKETIFKQGYVSVGDVQLLPSHATQERDLFPRLGISSFLDVVMYGSEGNITGFIGLAGITQHRSWGLADRLALRILAGILGSALESRRAMQMIQRQSQYRVLILGLAQSFINFPIHECDAVINNALERIGVFFKADRAYVFDYDFDNQTSSNTYEWCAAGVSSEINGLQNIPLDHVSHWLECHLRGEPLFVGDVQSLPESHLRMLLESQGIQSLINVPLMNGHECLGYVGLDIVNKNSVVLGRDEQELLALFAKLLVNVQLRLQADLVMRQSETRAKAQRVAIAKLALNSNLIDGDMTDAVRFLLRTLSEALEVDRTSFWILNNHDLHCIVAYHAQDESFSDGQVILRENIPRYFKILKSAEVISIDNTQKDVRLLEWSDLYTKKLGISSLIDAGIFIDGEVAGLISAEHLGPPRQWHLDEQSFVSTVAAIATQLLLNVERKKAEEQLKEAASVFQHANEGIMITESDGTIVDVNEAFTRITGYTADEAIGQNPRILKSGKQDKAAYETMWKALLTERSWTGEIWNRRKNGEVYAERQTISAVLDDEGEVKRYVALFSDISALKAHQEQLEYIAHYDALTGLPNRVLLADRMQQAMSQALRRGEKMAVVYLDLDGFKEINDAYGHSVGDRFLIMLSANMKSTLRSSDSLARLGGDEFVVIMTDLSSTDSCFPLLSRLLSASSESVQIQDRALKVSASLGVTFFPQVEAIDAEQLLRQADHAMYQAKMSGKNRYHIFDAEQDRFERDRHQSVQRLEQALNHNEFELFYQPKVNMQTHEIIGLEALIRWRHPKKGILSPGYFLSELHHHPLMVRLGDWVLNTALAQMSKWLELGVSVIVSVNVDPMQMVQPDFVEKLKHLLLHYPTLEPQSLELEVLETSAIEDMAHVSALLKSCKQLGVRIALDDFGTGYSSLSYLKRLPVDVIKIDQAFVRDMLDDADDRSILQGIVGLAEAFNRQVIAEGVETEAHAQLLIEMGCILGQGYAIAKPMPAEEVLPWLASYSQSVH